MLLCNLYIIMSWKLHLRLYSQERVVIHILQGTSPSCSLTIERRNNKEVKLILCAFLFWEHIPKDKIKWTNKNNSKTSNQLTTNNNDNNNNCKNRMKQYETILNTLQSNKREYQSLGCIKTRWVKTKKLTKRNNK